MRLNSSTYHHVASNSCSYESGANSGKLMKRLTGSATAAASSVPMASVSITTPSPFLKRYTVTGTSTKASVMMKFAISPTPTVPESSSESTSLMPLMSTDASGPYIKPPSSTNTLEKSSCKKGAPGKMGNSKKVTA